MFWSRSHFTTCSSSRRHSAPASSPTNSMFSFYGPMSVASIDHMCTGVGLSTAHGQPASGHCHETNWFPYPSNAHLPKLHILWGRIFYSCPRPTQELHNMLTCIHLPQYLRFGQISTCFTSYKIFRVKKNVKRKVKWPIDLFTVSLEKK